jgi:hypothetical protein
MLLVVVSNMLWVTVFIGMGNRMGNRMGNSWGFGPHSDPSVPVTSIPLDSWPMDSRNLPLEEFLYKGGIPSVLYWSYSWKLRMFCPRDTKPLGVLAIGFPR